MKIFKKTIIIVIISFLPVFSIAQGGSSKSAKKTEQRKAEREQEALEKYQAAIKRHNKNQSKDTRKRMKQSRKLSQGKATGNKEFFLKRWFRKKKK